MPRTCAPPGSHRRGRGARRGGRGPATSAEHRPHGGSLTTVHANNAESALSRIASCAMQGGGELPWEVTCRGVVDGIAMVIHMTRHEGRRFVEEALVVKGYEAAENRWVIQPVWPASEALEPPGNPSQTRPLPSEVVKSAPGVSEVGSHTGLLVRLAGGLVTALEVIQLRMLRARGVPLFR